MDSLSHYLQNVPHKRIAHGFSELYPILQERITIGDGPRWKQAFESLPLFDSHTLSINNGTVMAGNELELSVREREICAEHLKQLIPWRKGPFNIYGTYIDTEWQSNLKWERLKDYIRPISNKIVLDVGCNNGYYMFRMLEHAPKLVIGIDPSVLCYYQFLSVKKSIQAPALHFLPCGLEEMDAFAGVFDTVFSMGIMYHRKSPFEYLKQTLDFLKDGGEAIIETITIPGDQEYALSPKDRYAQMRNVYFLPTIPCLMNWIEKTGFVDCKVIDSTPTTPGEQRDTEWVNRKSLPDFLNPLDSSLTIEGYPAPIRTTIVAHKRPKPKFSF